VQLVDKPAARLASSKNRPRCFRLPRVVIAAFHGLLRYVPHSLVTPGNLLCVGLPFRVGLRWMVRPRLRRDIYNASTLMCKLYCIAVAPTFTVLRNGK
jgi:hypothetical protein